MDKTKHYYFIVNPASRSGRGKILWQQLKPLLKKRNIHYHVFFTKCKNSAERYARHLAQKSTEDIYLIVMGGDGTLNETVNGIVNMPHVKLGYIPTGSSNDFARAHAFSKDIEDILDMILKASEAPIDTGTMTANCNLSKAFIVSTGIGYDAAVTTRCNISPIKKILNKCHLGKLAYLFIGIQYIFTSKMDDMTISVDNEPAKTYKKVFFLSAHNHRYEGGGFAFAPVASPDDGYLDICIIHGLNHLQLIPVLLASMKGQHYHFKGVKILRCKQINICTTTPQPVHADGEACGKHRQIDIICRPQTLNMLLE